MSDDEHDGEVLAFRQPSTGRPVVVPTDVATMAERPYRAYQMRLAGRGWKDVAEVEGYPSAQAARADVDRYMREGAALVSDWSRKQLLTFELDRLDQLQAALWPQAMAGHIPAVNTSLQLVLSRVKLLALDQPSAEDSATSPRTVVVPTDDDGWKSSLERVVQGGE